MASRNIRVGHSAVLNGVFRVDSIAERRRFRGEPYFTLILATHARRYTAIAGPQAGCLDRGDLVHVHGCILFRQGEPTLVVCSLKRVEQPASQPLRVKRA